MTLHVKLTVEPPNRKTIDLGDIEIINVTRDPTRLSSDYAWRIRSRTANDEPIDVSGYVVDSYNDSAMQLVHEVLSEWVSKRKLPIDNHGIATLPEGIPLSASEVWRRIDSVRKEQD